MAEERKKTALIAMSGGVDSSVAAFLMKENGFECMGVTMKLFDNGDVGIPREHSCCSLDDIEDARSVAARLDIPYHVFNFADRFRDKVIEPFIYCYENGITPNPCIDCNRYLKFEKLFTRARELGAEYVVTGHYASVCFDEKSGRFLLKKGRDATKDQSYVLYSMTQEQLSHTIFPLGDHSKSEIRELAGKIGLINADKPDSQDICFVTNGRYGDFIKEFTGREYPEGDFVDTNGRVLGRHRGVINYTVGQRKGLGLSLPAPMYVKEIDVKENRVVLARDDELFSDTLYAENVNLIPFDGFEGGLRVKAKIRYRHKEDMATAYLENGRLRVVFDRPQRAITKGQAVVLYDDDIVVGGGTICGV